MVTVVQMLIQQVRSVASRGAEACKWTYSGWLAWSFYKGMAWSDKGSCISGAQWSGYAATQVQAGMLVRGSLHHPSRCRIQR